jgi:hypothetical protein
MTARVFARIAVSIVAVLVAFARAANAAPLVVTSGSFHMSFGDPTVFRLTGDDFDLSGIYSGSFSGLGPFQTCLHCAPGSTIDLSSEASGPIGLHVTGHLHGVDLSNAALSGELRFDAPALRAPATIGRAFELDVLTAPFLFNGQLSAFATGEPFHVDPVGPPLFSAALTGAGNVAFVIEALTTSQFEFSDVSYRFASAPAAATPEPATLVLLAGGLLSARAVRRRPNRHSTGDRPA